MPHEVLFFRIFAVIAIVGGIVYFYQLFPLKQKKTERLLRTIKVAAIDYHGSEGHFPNSIDDLIRKNPLRKDWKQDYWGTQLKTESSVNYFRITSAASDLTFNTSDDILVEIKE